MTRKTKPQELLQRETQTHHQTWKQSPRKTIAHNTQTSLVLEPQAIGRGSEEKQGDKREEEQEGKRAAKKK